MERRRNERCRDDVGIVFSYLNKTERYAGVARNYSRFGMYFEADRVLSPGTLIVIQPLSCEDAGNIGAASSKDSLAPSYCAGRGPNAGTCRQLKNLVVAQVKWCGKVDVPEPERYGIGVHYVSPAV